MLLASLFLKISFTKLYKFGKIMVKNKEKEKMKSKRSKACDISQEVKKRVWERDEHRCIICGNPQAMPNAHYIPRSKGGLGIDKNIVTLCFNCHHTFDQTTQRPYYRVVIKKYLQSKYDDWNEDDLIYKN